jgi:type II secretory pathway component GspD/PulD (secretin)
MYVSAALDRSPKGKPAAKADFVLTVKANLISLKAKDASLKEVLKEMGHRLKIEVVAEIPDAKTITAEFENLSPEEAVNRLSTIILMSWIQQREKERSPK